MKKIIYKIVAMMLTSLEDKRDNNRFKVGKINETYYIYHNSSESIFGTSVSAFGIVRFNWFIPIINIGALDNYIYDKDEMQFILNHELGHCHYNHFKGYKGRNLEQEIEADVYAMNIVGKENAIKTLERMKSECIFRGMNKAAIELELRIQACKNN